MITQRSIQNVFSLSFPFFLNFFFAFFLFSCVVFSFFSKNDQKKEKIPDIALRKNYLRFICVRNKINAKELFALLCERIICVRMRKNYLRYYAKELFAFVCERIICVIMRKNYLRSYAKELFAFFVFLHRNKKVTWTIRHKLIG